MGNAFGYLNTEDNPDPTGDMNPGKNDDTPASKKIPKAGPYVALISPSQGFTAPPIQPAINNNFMASRQNSRMNQQPSHF
mgnify:CR=1 FL=1|tara:strand:+ start:443 stop:682 length:240 start_codon:yes stop_codon:yes gene_type:complete